MATSSRSSAPPPGESRLPPSKQIRSSGVLRDIKQRIPHIQPVEIKLQDGEGNETKRLCTCRRFQYVYACGCTHGQRSWAHKCGGGTLGGKLGTRVVACKLPMKIDIVRDVRIRHSCPYCFRHRPKNRPSDEGPGEA